MDQNRIHLSQWKYILDVSHQANMVGAKPSPIAFGDKLPQHDGYPLLDDTEYRNIIGALQ